MLFDTSIMNHLFEVVFKYKFKSIQFIDTCSNIFGGGGKYFSFWTVTKDIAREKKKNPGEELKITSAVSLANVSGVISLLFIEYHLSDFSIWKKRVSRPTFHYEKVKNQ
jgi:hypothetical protein